MNTGQGRFDRYWEATVRLLYKRMEPEVNKMIRDALKDGDGSIAYKIKPNGSIGAKFITRKKSKRPRK